jgi:hypothetical protein
MDAADLVTTIASGVLALAAGAVLLYRWTTVARSKDMLLGVPMMCTISAVAAFSVVMVVTTLAELAAWLRVLLCLVAGAVTGFGSRSVWRFYNALLTSVRRKDARVRARGATP